MSDVYIEVARAELAEVSRKCGRLRTPGVKFVALNKRYAFFEGVIRNTNAGADQRVRLDDDAVQSTVSVMGEPPKRHPARCAPIARKEQIINTAGCDQAMRIFTRELGGSPLFLRFICRASQPAARISTSATSVAADREKINAPTWEPDAGS